VTVRLIIMSVRLSARYNTTSVFLDIIHDRQEQQQSEHIRNLIPCRYLLTCFCYRFTVQFIYIYVYKLHKPKKEILCFVNFIYVYIGCMQVCSNSD
jgi:hypothetical protein